MDREAAALRGKRLMGSKNNDAKLFDDEWVKKQIKAARKEGLQEEKDIVDYVSMKEPMGYAYEQVRRQVSKLFDQA